MQENKIRIFKPLHNFVLIHVYRPTDFLYKQQWKSSKWRHQYPQKSRVVDVSFICFLRVVYLPVKRLCLYYELGQFCNRNF